MVSSTSDERTVNNTMRHAYRVLTDAEKAQMQAVKDKGLELFDLIESLRTEPVPADPSNPNGPMIATFDRELSIAQQKVEEAVMWAVKHITR
jgi:hypothetical protein